MKKFKIKDRVVVTNPSFVRYARTGYVVSYNHNGTPCIEFENDHTCVHIREENLDFYNGGKGDKYILWQPGSHLPPKVTYSTYNQALHVAKDMAKRHGKTFIICKLDTEVKLSDFVINKL